MMVGEDVESNIDTGRCRISGRRFFKEVISPKISRGVIFLPHHTPDPILAVMIFPTCIPTAHNKHPEGHLNTARWVTARQDIESLQGAQRFVDTGVCFMWWDI
jgi:hypothetical protein